MRRGGWRRQLEGHREEADISDEGTKFVVPEGFAGWRPHPTSREKESPVLEEWLRRGIGIYLLALEADPKGKAPWIWGDAAGWIIIP